MLVASLRSGLTLTDDMRDDLRFAGFCFAGNDTAPMRDRAGSDRGRVNKLYVVANESYEDFARAL